jgi:hypothetical protein
VQSLDANFDANKAVTKAMGDSPAYCLAMTVFGDPLAMRPGANDESKSRKA